MKLKELKANDSFTLNGRTFTFHSKAPNGAIWVCYGITSTRPMPYIAMQGSLEVVKCD